MREGGRAEFAARGTSAGSATAWRQTELLLPAPPQTNRKRLLHADHSGQRGAEAPQPWSQQLGHVVLPRAHFRLLHRRWRPGRHSPRIAPGTHESFDRDFRGDTVHPATLELLEQLGLLDRVFELPHARMADFAIHFPDGSVSPPGRRRPGARHPYALQVPQPRFLEMLVAEARRSPAFHLVTGARAEQLLLRDGIIHGVRYRARDGRYEVRAKLVVGADGRFSKIRQLAGLQLAGTAESVDVLWLRLPHGLADPGPAYLDLPLLSCLGLPPRVVSIQSAGRAHPAARTTAAPSADPGTT